MDGTAGAQELNALAKAMGGCHSRQASRTDESHVEAAQNLPTISSKLSSAARSPAVWHAAFILLLAFNIWRVFHHPMWRDELQAFQLAAHAPTLSDVFAALKYEGHAGLWQSLLWLVSRFTSDPVSMQVLHVVLAVAVWLMVYRLSPFSLIDKFLLLLSYFLFWEYFVISRSYVMAALFGFAFAAMRKHRPTSRFLPWLLLGLLANVGLHSSIWSIALAAGLAWTEAQTARPAALAGGAASYLLLLAAAIATMIPAQDFSFGAAGADLRFTLARLGNAIKIPIGAFLPVNLHSIGDTVAFLMHAGHAQPAYFWNLNATDSILALTAADADHPLRLFAVLTVPPAACWLVTRQWLRLAEFSATYVGILLFADIWNFVGAARHYGIVFLAFVVAAWMAWSRRPPGRVQTWTLRALLLVSAVGGLMSLNSELRPFSQSRNAAIWIEHNSPAEAFLVGSRDAQTSAVAGYLGRRVYYLECECLGRNIVWNTKRKSPLSAVEFERRLTRALPLADGRPIILVLNRPMASGAIAPPGYRVTPLKSFVGAEAGENYWIYRIEPL